MASDAAFLSEIDRFLDSCNLPTPRPLSGNNSITNDSLVNEIDSLIDDSFEGGPDLLQINFEDKISRNAVFTNGDRSTKKMKNARHIAYRERQREERKSLEQEVAELTEILAKEPARLMALSTWKMVAKRQKNDRIKSEARYQQLCAAVLSQASLIREYRRLIQERSLWESATAKGDWDNAPCHQQNIKLEPFDMEVYKTYAANLNEVYAQTNEVFNSCGLDSTEQQCGSVKTQRENKGYFQLTNKQISPFDFQKTCAGIWRPTPLHYLREDRQVYDNVEDPQNTVALKFRITSRLKNGTIASLLQRVVIRRYLEDSRMVVVWRTFIEGEDIFEGMHADETGWGITTPVTKASDPGCVLRTCARYVPMNIMTPAPAIEQFHGVVVKAGTENVLEVTNSFEKMGISEE